MTPELENLFQEETAAYEQMRQGGYEAPIWILPEPSCTLLQKLAGYVGPQALAFEFGSGRSTLALRSVCAGVTSVEDSAEWLEKTEALPQQIPKRASDLTAVVPLSTACLAMVPFKSFDLSHHSGLLQRLQAADLILVDSPPNPATREHALFTALQHAKVDALIVLDDLDVPTTKRFAKRLAATNPHSLDFRLVEIDHELGVFRKAEKARIVYAPTLREIIGAWRRS